MIDALGGMRRVLVLGGSSEIAIACVRRLLAERTRQVTLAVRDPQALESVAAQLRAAGAEIEVVAFDARDHASHEAFVTDRFAADDIDLVLLAFGVLGDQRHAERDAAAAREIIETNYLGAVSVLIPLLARLREQGHGTVVILSSVAAERPRRANFIYGSSKAGLDFFAQGLSDSLVGSGVRVLVVRPGFVITKMTAGLPRAPFATTAERVADAVIEGLRGDATTVWVPGSLRWVMAVLRHLPRALFRRLPG